VIATGGIAPCSVELCEASVAMNNVTRIYRARGWVRLTKIGEMVMFSRTAIGPARRAGGYDAEFAPIVLIAAFGQILQKRL
jgi:hypothetical protein